MAEAKTKPTDASVAKYLDAVPDKQRRADGQAIATLMKRVTKQEPKMWGTSIVGFGSYHSKYQSGREGDAPLVGFSVRKSKVSQYGMAGSDSQWALLAKLGKFKAGKGCLYVKRLADVDLKVVERLITQSFAAKRKR